MIRGLLIVALCMPATAHRLDEYLQAALISVAKDRVTVELRLIPGVAVSSTVLGTIDTNGDGAISADEQQTYAHRVLSDVLLAIDGQTLQPQLISANFPGVAEMKEGLGEIKIDFAASLPRREGVRRLTLRNRHQNRIAAYLMNCLVPEDRDIRIVAQSRDETQSFYQIDYMQDGSGSPWPFGWLRGSYLWIALAGLVLIAQVGRQVAVVRLKARSSRSHR